MSQNNQPNSMNFKKKLPFLLFFLVIAGISIIVIVNQSKDFSLSGFIDYIKNADLLFLLAAVACMLSVIVFEGASLLCICKHFGYRRKFRNGFVYSAADIYFSAITPSATGGQPASAYFMMKDSIPGAVTTFALLLNLVMYTIAIIVIACISLIFAPGVFLNFDAPAKLLIIVGGIVQCGLAVMFGLLLKKSEWFRKIAYFFLKVGRKLHLVRNMEKWETKLEGTVAEYRRCSDLISEHRHLLWKTLVFNILQRTAYIGVTVFTFLASGGEPGLALSVLATHSLALMGSNCIPLPGSIGVADYLLLNGFAALTAFPVELELFSRALSFYFCTFLCGITILIHYFIIKGRKQAL